MEEMIDVMSFARSTPFENLVAVTLQNEQCLLELDTRHIKSLKIGTAIEIKLHTNNGIQELIHEITRIDGLSRFTLDVKFLNYHGEVLELSAEVSTEKVHPSISFDKRNNELTTILYFFVTAYSRPRINITGMMEETVYFKKTVKE